ncbi:MAG: hypothetical protein PF495_13110, partial [Spirochaetales bacterium]|nr:hypothetical protein [Spirochaetales bacterium]
MRKVDDEAEFAQRMTSDPDRGFRLLVENPPPAVEVPEEQPEAELAAEVVNDENADYLSMEPMDLDNTDEPLPEREIPLGDVPNLPNLPHFLAHLPSDGSSLEGLPLTDVEPESESSDDSTDEPDGTEVGQYVDFLKLKPPRNIFRKEKLSEMETRLLPLYTEPNGAKNFEFFRGILDNFLRPTILDSTMGEDKKKRIGEKLRCRPWRELRSKLGVAEIDETEIANPKSRRNPMAEPEEDNLVVHHTSLEHALRVLLKRASDDGLYLHVSGKEERAEGEKAEFWHTTNWGEGNGLRIVLAKDAQSIESSGGKRSFDYVYVALAGLPYSELCKTRHYTSLAVLDGPEEAHKGFWPVIQRLLRECNNFYCHNFRELSGKGLSVGLPVSIVAVLADGKAMNLLFGVHGHGGYHPCPLCEGKRSWRYAEYSQWRTQRTENPLRDWTAALNHIEQLFQGNAEIPLGSSVARFRSPERRQQLVRTLGYQENAVFPPIPNSCLSYEFCFPDPCHLYFKLCADALQAVADAMPSTVTACGWHSFCIELSRNFRGGLERKTLLNMEPSGLYWYELEKLLDMLALLVEDDSPWFEPPSRGYFGKLFREPIMDWIGPEQLRRFWKRVVGLVVHVLRILHRTIFSQRFEVEKDAPL